MVNIKQVIAWNREQLERALLRAEKSPIPYVVACAKRDARRYATNISTLEAQL